MRLIGASISVWLRKKTQKGDEARKRHPLNVNDLSCKLAFAAAATAAVFAPTAAFLAAARLTAAVATGVSGCRLLNDFGAAVQKVYERFHTRTGNRYAGIASIRDDWQTDWTDLPGQFQLILDDMGGCLHDTVSAPEIAENFDSIPEQLLVRVRKVEV